jgi:hypothetical protein
MRFWTLILLICLATGAPAQGPKQIVVQVNELLQPRYERVDVSGRRHDGIVVRYIAERRVKHRDVFFRSFINGRPLQSARLPELKYPSMDLSTLQLFYDTPNDVAEISLRFGARRSCFENDDGRDILTIYLTPSHTNIHVESRAGCEQKLR